MRLDREITDAVVTHANLMLCNYEMALSSRISTPNTLDSHSSNIEITNVIALLLSPRELQIVQ